MVDLAGDPAVREAATATVRAVPEVDRETAERRGALETDRLMRRAVPHLKARHLFKVLAARLEQAPSAEILAGT
jgi:hypothetical protein